MLNKLKQFKDIRQQAKSLQSTLAEETITIKESGVSLTMDGNLAVKSIDIDKDMLTPNKKEKLEKAITKAF